MYDNVWTINLSVSVFNHYNLSISVTLEKYQGGGVFTAFRHDLYNTESPELGINSEIILV